MSASVHEGPKTTVLIRAYNQESFVAQAIESALAQQTARNFEIIIGDDCSSDGTREIIRAYAARHPALIRLFFPEQNVGRHRMFSEPIAMSRGDYLAILDGDDFWTSPHKLQKQIDYLDAHPDCSFCFHHVEVVREDGSPAHRYLLPEIKARYRLMDFLHIKGGAQITPQTGSVMFRRSLMPGFPEWMFRLPMVDLPLFALLARQGFAGFIDESMSAYRVHSGGFWTAGGEAAWTPEISARRQEWMLAFFEAMRHWLEHEFAAELDERISDLSYDLAWHHQRHGDVRWMRKYLLNALRHDLRPRTVSKTFAIKAWLVAFVPFAHRIYRRRKQAIDLPR